MQKYLDIRYYSYSIANWLYIFYNKNTDIKKTHQNRYEYFYTFSVILTGIFQILLLLIIGALLDIIYEMVIAMSVFASLRYFAGGMHVNTRKCCTIISITIMLISIYSGTLLNLYFILFLLIISLTLIFKFAPSDHFNKPILNPNIRKKSKVISLILFLSWTLFGYAYSSLGIVATSIFLESLTLVKKNVH